MSELMSDFIATFFIMIGVLLFVYFLNVDIRSYLSGLTDTTIYLDRVSSLAFDYPFPSKTVDGVLDPMEVR